MVAARSARPGPRPDCWRAGQLRAHRPRRRHERPLPPPAPRLDVRRPRGHRVGRGRPSGSPARAAGRTTSASSSRSRRRPSAPMSGQPGWFLTRSLPVTFSDPSVTELRPTGVPRTGDVVVSANELADRAPFKLTRRPVDLPAVVPLTVGRRAASSRVRTTLTRRDGWGLSFATPIGLAPGRDARQTRARGAAGLRRRARLRRLRDGAVGIARPHGHRPPEPRRGRLPRGARPPLRHRSDAARAPTMTTRSSSSPASSSGTTARPTRTASPVEPCPDATGDGPVHVDPRGRSRQPGGRDLRGDAHLARAAPRARRLRGLRLVARTGRGRARGRRSPADRAPRGRAARPARGRTSPSATPSSCRRASATAPTSRRSASAPTTRSGRGRARPPSTASTRGRPGARSRSAGRPARAACRTRTRGCDWDGDANDAIVTYRWQPTEAGVQPAAPWLPRARIAITEDDAACVPALARRSRSSTRPATPGRSTGRCRSRLAATTMPPRTVEGAHLVYLDPLVPPATPGTRGATGIRTVPPNAPDPLDGDVVVARPRDERGGLPDLRAPPVVRR